MADTYPPKPRMAIRVGVTGHRQQALIESGFDESQLRASIHQVLVRIQNTAMEILHESEGTYAPQDPLFRVISPLAEGSDRLVAEEALELGFEIQCPLPFPEDEYEVDFATQSSKSQFRKLLSQASSVFLLNGSPTKRDSAYKAIGQMVLRQSDVLIAVWNGKHAKGTGGTGEVVKKALQRNVPTVWISSDQPHSVMLLEKVSKAGEAEIIQSLDEEIETQKSRPEKLGTLAGLKKVLAAEPDRVSKSTTGAFESRLHGILAPPTSKHQLMLLQRFLGEAQPRSRCALLYKLFCKVFVPSWGVPQIEVKDFETDGEEEKWLQRWTGLSSPNDSVGYQIEDSYRRPFIWADAIADICADRHRSSFIATYLLGALAVLAAFLGSQPLSSAGHEAIEAAHGYFFLEFVFIGAILLLVQLNKRQHWHERWIDYRLLAEGLRQMRALAPFARVTPSFEVPAYFGENAPTSTWFNWYFRAVVRNAGMVRATVDRSYLDFCRTVLISEIASQVRYHRKNASKHKFLHHRLHKLSSGLFWLTLIACIAHISSLFSTPTIEFALSLCAIVLPAFGAAIQGILHQGDFGKLENRSRALRRSLYELQSKITAPGVELSFRSLGKHTESYSKIQIAEQADWRSLFIIKDISLP